MIANSRLYLSNSTGLHSGISSPLATLMMFFLIEKLIMRKNFQGTKLAVRELAKYINKIGILRVANEVYVELHLTII